MDVLLTPFVNRLLRRFIKRAAGEETSQLRVSLSRGSVALHNLELNLDELTARLPVSVKRAFARQLTITVPWTSFASQPLQARISSLTLARRSGSLNCVVALSGRLFPCRSPSTQ